MWETNQRYADAHAADLSSRNQVVSALSFGSRSQLVSAAERVEITRGDVLSRAGSTVSHFFFVESGMVSLIKPMQNGQGAEIGAVGLEGMAPPVAGAIFDCPRAIFDSVVQISGTALCIRRDVLEQLLVHDAELLQLMRAYTGVALNQLVQTAACNTLHLVDQRCSRWLLQAHDRASSDSFALTHEFLAMTLGVRRASVSVAAERLQRAGLIQYNRGNVRISDRRGLEQTSCECYATMRHEIAVFFAKHSPISKSRLLPLNPETKHARYEFGQTGRLRVG